MQRITKTPSKKNYNSQKPREKINTVSETEAPGLALFLQLSLSLSASLALGFRARTVDVSHNYGMFAGNRFPIIPRSIFRGSRAVLFSAL